MTKIELVSLVVHKFEGKVRKKGERIFATEREARVLQALRRAAPVESDPAPVADKPKRAYRRRDIAPDNVAVLEAEPVQVEVTSIPDTFPSLREVFTRPKKTLAE